MKFRAAYRILSVGVFMKKSHFFVLLILLVTAVSAYNCSLFKDKVDTPQFTPQGGVYHTVQTVTITCATIGATIRYTLDNSDPSPTHGFIYENSGLTKIYISSGTTLKAIAYKPGLKDSDIAAAAYAIPSFGFLDQTFGNGGKVTTDNGIGTNNEANAVAIQRDGKIVLAG